MLASDIVLIITAVGVLVGTIASAIVTLRRVDAVKTELKQDVKEVHSMANQRLTDILAYQEKLIKSLQASNIAIPSDESLQPRSK